MPEGELLFSHPRVTIPNARVQRAPGQREQGSGQAEGTGFQGDQGWSQGQRAQCLFSIIPSARLTGLHTYLPVLERVWGFRGL